MIIKFYFQWNVAVSRWESWANPVQHSELCILISWRVYVQYPRQRTGYPPSNIRSSGASVRARLSHVFLAAAVARQFYILPPFVVFQHTPPAAGEFVQNRCR